METIFPYLPSWTVLVTFSIAATILAITPGPDMTLFLGRTLTQGRLAGIASLMGASTGIIIHTIFAVVGLSALLAASPTGFWALKIVGALYLLWLAFQAVFNSSVFELNPQDKPTVSLLHNYLMGIGVNILNPKVVIFYMTFLPQFVSAVDPSAWKKMLFLGLYSSVLTAPMMICLILVANEFAELLKRQPTLSRGIHYLFGTVFTIFAVKILLTEGK